MTSPQANSSKLIYIFLLGRGCYYNLTAAAGTISSHDNTARNKDDTVCTTEITVDIEKRILLNFTAFNMENVRPWSYIEIVGGQNRYYHIKPSLFVSQTNKLKITMKINHQPTSSGYNATYRTVGKYLVFPLQIGLQKTNFDKMNRMAQKTCLDFQPSFWSN